MLLLSLAVAEPLFSEERGLKEQPFELSIEGQDLRVAVGPTAIPSAYEGPILIEHNTVVRALEVVDGEWGDEVVHTYLFLDEVMAPLDPSVLATDGDTVARTLSELPLVALTVGQALSLTEQPVSLEWLDPEGVSLQVNAGVRKVGGHSLNYEKNNLRLNFRKSYGAGRWEADLYQDFASGLEPATRHDSLTLRGGSHDSVFYLGDRGQYLRNRWMDESQLAMGHLAPHGRYAHVLLNQAYIGLYHVRERFGAGLLSEMLGGQEEDYEAVNGGVVVDGGGSAWSQVIAARGDYEASRELLDVVNLLDYMLLNFYAGNAWDWSAEHNWMAAGPVEPSSGWIFHNSDADICLVYGLDVNILSLPGPSWLFSELASEGHPDFMVLLADRVHALFEDEGPLTPLASIERYEALSWQIEDAVVAESARWGAGWWTREGQWEVERDYLLDQWFVGRTEVLLQQLRDQGWYAIGAPVFSRDSGLVDPGDRVQVSLPEGAWSGGVVLTLDGSDPRLPGGELSGQALGPSPSLELLMDGTRHITARVLDGSDWGPLHQETYAVAGSPSVVLNEWNAVGPEELLAEGDPALGQVAGNGGPWLELLVLRDTDLSGLRLVQRDRTGTATLRFGTDERLALRAGSLLTIARDLPEDVAYDPAAGDWRMHLQVGGELIEGELIASNRDWTVELLDDSGRILWGPVGEGVSLEGLGPDEVAQLAAQPQEPPVYSTSEGSTFGAPNRWGSQTQDLSGLRTLHRPGPDAPVTLATCGFSAAPMGLFALALVLVGCRREDPVGDCFEDQDGDGWGGETTGCTGSTVLVGGDCEDLDEAVNPGAAEVCGGGDEDCDGLVDDEDPDLADPMPLFEDQDGDGFGGEVVTACRLDEGFSLVGGDCDDQDAQTWPGAPESCDEVDSDCDGVAGGSPGQGEECPASSCLEALELGISEDGPVWLELADGGTAPIWCDMERGGWTLAFVRNSASSGNQGDFGAADRSVGDLMEHPGDSSLSEGRMGWLDLNLFDWSELRLAGYTQGAETALTDTVPRSELRLAFGEPGYLLYGPDIYWCGGPASYTDAGVGAVDNPEGAPLDCKGHGSLGSGWDFSGSPSGNQGLTLCGSDGSAVMTTAIGGAWVYYGAAGGSQAIWVR